MSRPDSELRAAILGEIESRGPIPFARFMELCLYHPQHGYYTRGLGGGGGRDYLTSSGTHRAFGVLVARQAEEMWRRMGRPDPFYFVEFGPGEGRFAQDFLDEAVRNEGFARALQYRMVEPSPALSARQRSRVSGGTPIRIDWASEEDLEALGRFDGCLFANEVLDAFPVHRVVGTPAGVSEVHVAAHDGRLQEELGPLSTAALQRFLDQADLAPEAGQEVDLNLAAPCWISWALGLLSRGYLLVIDYGYEARDLYHPARRRGTLLAYHRHRVSEQFLSRPGEQDLTAHVDFSALRGAAERAGARSLGLVTQSRFLLSLGALDFLMESNRPAGAGTRVEILVRAVRDREALKELILPGRMGERFKVLAVAVGDVPQDLAGLAPPWASAPAERAGRALRTSHRAMM